MDNISFRLQMYRIHRFYERYKVERQFVMVANNPRFAILAAELPRNIPKDVYIVDDFMADSRLYNISQSKARKTLERLIADSDRLFAISPISADDLAKRYGKPCSFLPLPISERLMNLVKTTPRRTSSIAPINLSQKQIIIHHSGVIHHLYADALAEIARIFEEVAESRQLHIRLELWGRLDAANVRKALKMNIDETTSGRFFDIKICGEVDPIELTRQQQRATFLLLVNTFMPQHERQVRCSFSSKVCEYLISGVPILLYAPRHSSLTAHLSKYDAAHVICEHDHAKATSQITKILLNQESNSVIESAHRLATGLHSCRMFFKTLYPSPDYS